MSGELTSGVGSLSTPPPASPSGGTNPGPKNTGVVPPPLLAHHTDGPLMVVPAGIFADIVGGLAGPIGEITGGFFGHAQLGKTLGQAAGPLIEHFVPFQIVPPQVSPASAGPGGATQTGPAETLVVVPAGFLTGILGGLAGNLAGGAIGGLFGNKDLGSQIGSGVLGAVGSVFGPFSVVPPQVAPASAGPGEDQASPSEPMVVVPAGFFGDLLSGVAGTVGQIVAGDTGRQVGDVAGQLAKLLPFSAVPEELSPASSGPDGANQKQDLVVLPAGFFGSLCSGFAGTLGGVVGGLLGNAQAGSTIGNAVGSIGSLLPFHEVPPQLLPQADGAAADGSAQDKLMFVPAGLFGSLLSSLGGAVGGAVGGLFGNAQAGTTVGNAVGSLGSLLPFQVLPSATAGASSSNASTKE